MTVNFPGGLTRSRSQVGGTTQQVNPYPIKNGKAKNMFRGDPVRLSNGTLDIGTNTAAVLGVAVSFHWIDKTTNRPQYNSYFPSGTSNKNNLYNEGYTQPFALIDDNPRGTWIIKTDASVSNGEIGTIARVTNAGTGSAVTGRSGAEADTTGTAVSAGNGMFRIIQAYRVGEITSAGAQDNDFNLDQSTLLEVVFQNHLYG